MFGKGISREGDLVDLASNAVLSRRVEHGSHMRAIKSDRDVRMQSCFLLENPADKEKKLTEDTRTLGLNGAEEDKTDMTES